MKKLHLILTNPCSENWDDMQPSKAGRFCDKCEKHIVDLTQKSDTELIEFFKKKKENVCGRFLPTQLHRNMETPSPKTNWNWLLLPMAIGASVLTPAKAVSTVTTVVQNEKPFPSPVTQTKTTEIDLLDTIKGKVISADTGKPLKGVKVKIKGVENVVALTDLDGNFFLTTEKTEQIPTLVFRLEGYDVVERLASEDMTIKMEEMRRIMLGGISTITTSNEPLYVIYSGKKSCIANTKQQQNLNPEWIEKIDILKGIKAMALYGSKAVNGVIMIEIKKKYANKVDFSKKN